MPQTRKQSAIEAWVNTACAFGVSWMAHIWIIAPLVRHYDLDYGGVLEAFAITMFYTALSLIRNYVVRRAFVGMER